MPQQPQEPPARRRGPVHERRHPELERDRGMATTTIATRWIAAGSLAGVAVFAGLAAVSTDHASSEPTSPAVTEAPAADDAPLAATTPATAPATVPATAPATNSAGTTPATTPAPSAAATDPPSTVAPAQQAPASVPRNRRRSPVVTSGSS